MSTEHPDLATMRSMRAQGMTYTEIGRELHLCRNKVRELLHQGSRWWESNYRAKVRERAADARLWRLSPRSLARLYDGAKGLRDSGFTLREIKQWLAEAGHPHVSSNTALRLGEPDRGTWEWELRRKARKAAVELRKLERRQDRAATGRAGGSEPTSKPVDALVRAWCDNPDFNPTTGS